MKAAIVRIEGKLIGFNRINNFLKDRGVVVRIKRDYGCSNDSALAYLAIEFNNPEGVDEEGLSRLVYEMFDEGIFNGGSRCVNKKYKILLPIDSGFGVNADPENRIPEDINKKNGEYEERLGKRLGLKKCPYRREPETEALA